MGEKMYRKDIEKSNNVISSTLSDDRTIFASKWKINLWNVSKMQLLPSNKSDLKKNIFIFVAP